MKKWMLLLMLLLLGCAEAETTLCAVSVGKGDAILIRTEDCALLVDTAKGHAAGRIARALREMGIEKLDAVFITHIDKDHTEGLSYLAQSGLKVNAWFASALYGGKPKKHPLNQIGAEVQWLNAGDRVSYGGTSLTALCPFTLDGDEDNNSLVLLLENEDGRILLAGDMEREEEETLLGSGASLSCDVLKIPNHGDDDAAGADFLRLASPRCAVISTDSVEKPGTPNPALMKTLGDMGVQTLVTEGCSAVVVRLDRGEIDARRVDWAANPVEMELNVENKDERFFITNRSGGDVNLSGWYLLSETGDELYCFPEYILPPGGTVVVGTLSTEGNYDLLWNEKNVLSDKKDDPVILYDADGTPAAKAE